MTVSTHVLDLSRGVPAANLEVALYKFTERGRDELARSTTDGDGRIPAPFGGDLPAGEYELEFNAGAYFEAAGTQTFYDRIPIRFRVAEERHHHVPLLLSPWGYSTYRGS